MDFKHKLSKLANGLRVVTVPMSVPTVTALAMIGVGSRYETPRVGGISHFVEHLVFKGTRKYPTFMDIAEALDAIGSEHNAFTSKEYTGFYVKVASDHLELALDVLSQVIFEPRLPEEDIERERGVIVEEINMYEDTPMRRVGDLFDQLLYRGHSLGRDVIGTKKSVISVTRDDFLAHLEQWYAPGNMVLGIAGDKDKLQATSHKLQELVKRYFGTFRQHAGVVSNLSNLRNLRFQPSKTQQDKVGVHYKKTEQAHFVLGVRSIKRSHQDRYVQSVLATILGGNMSSRLFTEVREKRGLAYYIRTGVGAYHETGHLATQAGVTIDKISDAIKAVVEQYQKISEKNSVSQEELTKAKEYLKGKLLIEVEDSKEVASTFVNSLLLEGKTRTPEEMVRGVDAVTRDDVTRLAKKIFANKGLNLTIIGPYKKSLKFDKLLKV